MKIGICLIIKNENSYLEEWINYWTKLNIDKIFIYDNNSTQPIQFEHPLVEVILWDNEQFGSQNNAYTHCCVKNQDYDYIGFFDTDEFYVSETMDIKKDLGDLIKKFGEFNGFALYWRMYGKPKPYYQQRQPIENYTQYHKNDHIKSFIKPTSFRGLTNPHYFYINGRYIDELGRNVTTPIGNHTSEKYWIKHTWSRSESEFIEKLERGDVNWRKKINTEFNLFYEYNDKCILTD